MSLIFFSFSPTATGTAVPKGVGLKMDLAGWEKGVAQTPSPQIHKLIQVSVNSKIGLRGDDD